MLYDRESYGGTGRAPGYRRGDGRFYLNAAWQDVIGADCIAGGGTLWITPLTMTYEETRALVPPGGVYRDRTDNWPSPMVPIESWTYNAEPPAPGPPREAANA